MMQNVVLFLDDEQMLLDSIKRTLYKEPYEVKTCNNGDDALIIVKEFRPSVIVTDMNMPGMNGIEFLEKAQQYCQDSIYMVLSAYSDIDNIMKAVNEKHIWRYITKPWYKEDLKLALQNAVEMYNNRQENKELLSKLEKQNIKLTEINDILEKKVMERTIQLKEKNDILQLLIENDEIDSILERICKSISNKLYDSPVIIHVPFLNKTYPDMTIYEPDKIIAISNECMIEKREIENESGLCIPLIKNDNVLGTMFIAHNSKTDNTILKEIKENFYSTTVLCLMQAWSLQRIDNMLSDI